MKTTERSPTIPWKIHTLSSLPRTNSVIIAIKALGIFPVNPLKKK